MYVFWITLQYETAAHGLVVSKLCAYYLLEGAGWDWISILLPKNFSGSAGGVSGHA